jgi:hypothetical protein
MGVVQSRRREMTITRKYITRKRQFEPITRKIVSGLKDRN